jgi:hypothetical protein
MPIAACVLGAVLVLATSVVSAGGQDPEGSPVAVPFGVGERAKYDVKFGVIKVGSATMEVVGIESVRGREAYHTRFILKGGIPGYQVNDRFESWMDIKTLASLRFISEQEEGSRKREKHYEIFPERAVYTSWSPSTKARSSTSFVRCSSRSGRHTASTAIFARIATR